MICCENNMDVTLRLKILHHTISIHKHVQTLCLTFYIPLITNFQLLHILFTFLFIYKIVEVLKKSGI